MGGIVHPCFLLTARGPGQEETGGPVADGGCLWWSKGAAGACGSHLGALTLTAQLLETRVKSPQNRRQLADEFARDAVPRRERGSPQNRQRHGVGSHFLSVSIT